MCELKIKESEINSCVDFTNQAAPTFYNKYNVKGTDKTAYPDVFKAKMKEIFNMEVKVCDKPNIGKRFVSLYVMCNHAKRFVIQLSRHKFNQSELTFIVSRTNINEQCPCVIDKINTKEAILNEDTNESKGTEKENFDEVIDGKEGSTYEQKNNEENSILNNNDEQPTQESENMKQTEEKENEKDENISIEGNIFIDDNIQKELTDMEFEESYVPEVSSHVTIKPERIQKKRKSKAKNNMKTKQKKTDQ